MYTVQWNKVGNQMRFRQSLPARKLDFYFFLERKTFFLFVTQCAVAIFYSRIENALKFASSLDNQVTLNLQSNITSFLLGFLKTTIVISNEKSIVHFWYSTHTKAFKHLFEDNSIGMFNMYPSTPPPTPKKTCS